MFGFKLDIKEFERKAQQLGESMDQVPFALSLALNNSVQQARQVLIQSTWPRSVTVRRGDFISRALRTKFSTKYDLKVDIYDDLKRAHLYKHAFGGIKRPKGQRLAIPVKGRIPYTAQGPRPDMRPRALIANTPKRALRVTPRGIFIGQGGRLHLFYSFHSQAVIKKDVPFVEDFREAMREEMVRNFGPAMQRAMSTRK